MTHAEALQQATGLRERFAAPFSPADKKTIERLYAEVLGRIFQPTSCQNCYHDALVEIWAQLKRTTTMANERHYILKAGAIINSPEFHEGAIYVNENLTDEIAEEFLQMFPNADWKFAKMPEKKAKAAKSQNKARGGVKK